jgi:hypothetical protein
VFHQLGQMQPQSPLDLLLQLIHTFEEKGESGPGHVGFSMATVFMLKVKLKMCVFLLI